MHLNEFLIGGLVLLVVGYLVQALTTLGALGGVLITLGWVGLIIGLVLLIIGAIRR